MKKHNGLRAGLLLLVVAALRVLTVTGTDAAESRAVALHEDKPAVWVLHCLPPAEKAPVQPAAFSPEEAEGIAVGGRCSYTPKIADLLTAPCPVTPGEGPQVLIVHTHTSEAYTQTVGWTYAESDPLRTTQADRSVVQVGRELADALEAQGISCLHDESLNDFPDYNGAYGRSLGKVKDWLAQYPSIAVVLDVHRDAIADGNGEWLSENVGLNGEKCARVMLVVGTDEGGAEHPDWEDNLNFAVKVQAAVRRSYPALCKPIDLRRERFNQHLLPGSLLVEIGSAGNTLPEALTAAQAFGTALGAYLHGLM